jgi:uncharacterized protein YecE (DUF72 family)
MDGLVEDARTRIRALEGTETAIHAGRSVIRFGIAGWTHRTMVAAGVFFPPRTTTAEQRLRHYASVFSFVEVDSGYYAIPTSANAARWAERTPDGFLFDVKAHALMTGHAAELERLPAHIRAKLPASLAGKRRLRADSLPREVVDDCWTAFLDALRPLKDEGKLGSILLQFPPWLEPGRTEAASIVEAADRVHSAGMRCAVELRNASWFSGRVGDRTIEFLRERAIPFVIVDEPQGMDNSVPPVVAVTSPALAVFRFHGQRASTWDVPGVSVEERFRYLYSPSELEPWAGRILEAAERSAEVHVVFNNCYANFAPANALEMAAAVSRRLS